jgi:lysophospholipase L1-like esterase
MRMPKRPTLLAAFAALVAVFAFVVVTKPAQAAGPVRIMPLGDSITGSPGCWRALLWNRLQSTGFTNIDFVGTLPPQGCGVAHDGDNEGHGGILATNMANQNQLPPWLSATTPDVVIMHLGTNDVWSNIAPATILAAFSKLVDQMRASNPNMKILVAQILPMNPSNCADCGSRVVAFNNAIPGWAAGKSTAASPITVVDQWTGFSTGTDTFDGVHPNDAGNQKISNRWYPPLSSVLTGATASPSPSRSVSPSPSRSVSPSPSRSVSPSASPSGGAGACSATYSIVNQWPGAFQGGVTVRNNGTVALNGWTVRWTWPNGQVITQLWGGAPSASGSSVTVRNVDYNGTLAPGATVTFGFIANWTGSNGVPAPVTCTSP